MTELTKKEIKLILDSLCFFSTVDVCCDYEPEIAKKAAELAAKLAKEYDLKTSKSLYYSKSCKFEDEDIMKIIKPIVRGKWCRLLLVEEDIITIA